MIGIISYLPNDSELRKKRLEVISKTLEFIQTVFPEEVITIVDQQWVEDERKQFNNIKWLSFEKGIGAPAARNVILKEFYNSDDTWLILEDDDVSLYDYYDAGRLLRSIYYGQYDEYPMDLIVPLSPQIRPFKEKLLAKDVAHNYIFERMTLTDIPNFVILRNSDNPIYFDEKFDTRNMKENDDIISDDVEFVIRAMVSKRRCVLASCLIKKTMALYDSVIYTEETAEDTLYHRRLNNNLVRYIYANFNVNSSKFSALYNEAKAFDIQRDVPYELPERLATVSKRTRKKPQEQKTRLF